ncbi:MAG: U32 family peptidase, partial [Oscillospiraceae bacterium]|nr:U32 family peptidase [Oscillospiraceae bacterium]
LAAERTAVPARRAGHYAAPEPVANPTAPPLLTVSLSRAEQLTDRLIDARPAVVSLPLEAFDRLDLSPYLDQTRFCAALPRIYRTGDEALLRHRLREAIRRGVSAVGVGNLGHLALARDFDLEKRGDLSLNVFNSAALRFLKDQGLDTAAVSFELRREQVRDLQKCLPCEAVVYGRLPLMITENRVGDGDGILTDRRGERFPVLPVSGGRSEIENAKTLYLADRDDWRDIGLSYARLRFTTETPDECAAVLRAYVEGAGCAPDDLTRGLFYRGVE